MSSPFDDLNERRDAASYRQASAATDPFGDSLFHGDPMASPPTHVPAPPPASRADAPYGTSLFEGDSQAQTLPVIRSERLEGLRTRERNRLRAEDLADRGIPTFRNAHGDVEAIRDDTGTALNAFDRTHGIAYDSKGQPKQISYDETGPPKLTDAFADIPNRVDKQGNIFQKGKGLYRWNGTDEAVAAAAARKESDKEVAKNSALLGRKLSLDEYDYTHGSKEAAVIKKGLVEDVPTLADPKFAGADLPTVQKAISDHFDAQYAAPEANATAGWFGGGLSPEATALRATIDQKKEQAMAKAESVFAAKERLGGLHDSISSAREAQRTATDQLLAHAAGESGPLDHAHVTDAGSSTGNKMYPPVEDWSRVLGHPDASKAQLAQPEAIKQAVTDGAVPQVAGPAAVAAAHDAADAQKKADELRNSNPTLADQFEAAAKGILSGLGNGMAEVVKSPIGQGVLGLYDLSGAGLTHAAIKSLITGEKFKLATPEEQSKQIAAKIVAGNPAIEKRLEGTVGGKVGEFTGGILPYLAATVVSGPAAPAVDASLFFGTGYQHTYEDAKAHGASENVAHGAGLVNGAINAALALPLKVVGKAYNAIFGETAPKVVTAAIKNAYDHGGPEAVGSLLGKLSEAIKAGGAGSEELRQQSVAGIGKVLEEIQKPAAERLASVAKTAAAHAAIGGAVQTAQNVVSKSYDPSRGTFEGVPEQALGFGLLGAVSKGFEQVAAARKAKQALDLIAGGKEPPAAGASPTGPALPGPEGTPPATPAAPAPTATKPPKTAIKPSETPVKGAEKPVKAVEVAPDSTKPAKVIEFADDPKAPKVGATEVALAEKKFVEEGGHPDRLEGQQKLAALQKQFPDPAARVAAINAHLEKSAAPVVDESAHAAATSPKNDLPQPTPAQKEAGNYQKGHQVVGGLDISFENPAGSHRTNLDTTEVERIQGLSNGNDHGLLAHVLTRAKSGDAVGAIKQLSRASESLKINGQPELAKAAAALRDKSWATPLKSHYGYIKGTVGADKDHVDIFVKPGTPADYSGPVFVVNQHDKSGKFDEHKAVLGVATSEEALAEYKSNYEKGWTGGREVVKFNSPAAFKKWAMSPAVQKPAVTAPKRVASVALVDPSGKVLTHGAVGETTHKDLMKAAMGGADEEAILQAFENDKQHVFIDESGNTLTREEAAAIGTAGDQLPAGLKRANSEDFIAHKAKGKNEQTPAKQEGPSSPATPKEPVADAGSGAVASKPGEESSGFKVATADEARGHVEAAQKAHSEKLSRLGVPFIEKKFGGAGLKVSAGGGQPLQLHFDPEALAKSSRGVVMTGGNVKEWIHDAVNEEIYHAVDILTVGLTNFDAHHARLWKLLPKETRLLVRKHYESAKPWMLAAEYFRMLAQARAGERVTEVNYEDISGLQEMLEKPQPADVESYLKSMMRVLNEGPGEPVSETASEPSGKPVSQVPEPTPSSAVAESKPAEPEKLSKLQKRAAGLTFRLEGAAQVSPSERAIVETLIRNGSGKFLDQAEKKIDRFENRKPWPSFIWDYWAQSKMGEPTALTEGRLKLAGISREKMLSAIEKAHAAGMPEETILDRTKYTAPDLALRDFEEFAAKKGQPDATTAGEQPTGDKPEHIGTSQGQDLRPNEEKEGQEKGAQAISGDSPGERSPAPEKPAERPGLVPPLDDAAKAALNDAFEGLFAGKPLGLLTDSDKMAKWLEKQAGLHGLTIASMARNHPDLFNKLAKGWRNMNPGGKPLARTGIPFQDTGAVSLYAKIPQVALPPEKLAGFIKAAQELTRLGITTPEAFAATLEAMFHGKARPYSQALWDAMGMLTPELRATHDWDKFYLPGAPDTKEHPPEEPYKGAVKDVVASLLRRGETVDRRTLTKIANSANVPPKLADEQAEAAIVEVAREIAHGPGTQEEKFDKLVDLYDRQPNLTAKTSTSKVNQAYSTPAPLAYVAGVLAGLPDAKSAFEPTAGNGLLTIAGKPSVFTVNEINPDRLANLEGQGFGAVLNQDASKLVAHSFSGGLVRNMESVIANPPFGTVLEDGQTKEFPLWQMGGETTQIDHSISSAALTHMAENGRTVLLVGGKNIKDPDQRAEAYAGSMQARFWKPLYEKYRVIDHFTVSGDLYKKQGAGWPIDVVVIAGTGRSPIELPSARGPRIIEDWNGLRSELGRSDAERIEAGRYDPARHSAEVSGHIDSIRGIAGAGSDAGAQGSPKPADRPDVRGGGDGQPQAAAPGPGLEPTAPGPTGDSDVAPAGGEGLVGSRATAGDAPQRLAPDLASFRVPYVPASKNKPIGLFIPTNMEAPAREALGKLEKEVGSLDDYVRKALGYPEGTEMQKYFAGEQMDALALAINAIESGTAMVNGDQGGIGKGRTAAGMMVYAVEKGWTPVFVTKDVKLYAAMIKDLRDIGRGELVPMFTNNNLQFTDEKTGKVWKQGSMNKTMETVKATGKLPKGIDLLFTSYAQIQKDVPKGYKWPDKKPEVPPDGIIMEMLKRIIPNSLIVADESHLASGDSIRGKRLGPLMNEAKGVYYLSATFAKRPESMGIYSRTSLSHASTSMKELADAMSQGGVPLQQVVSATLASDGLYLRRERDFRNAVFRTHINLDTRERDEMLADNYTAGLRSILAISEKMKAVTKALNKIIRKQGEKMHVENPPRVEATNFASKLHNMISQYLFAIKAESAIQRAVVGVTTGFPDKDGNVKPHKVIIAVQNTMEAPIQGLATSKHPLSFKGMLLNYLDTQRTITSGRGNNAQTMTITDTPDPEYVNMSDQLLQTILIAPGVTDLETGESVAQVNEKALAELFRRIMAGVFKDAEDSIKKLELADMPLSPIDYIRQGLSRAGVKTAEVTKRGTGLDEDGKVYEIADNTNSPAAHLRYISEFNNGDTDVLIINASGSTGVSMHSSGEFKRTDPRAMLIVQPHLDINEFMQTLYRIDRTGQVHQPYYELLQTALPAELRPAAVLGAKMAGLNANTTSNAENEISVGNRGVDIFNQYGDEVVYQYLQSAPDFVELLQMPKIVDADGRLLPLEDVKEHYEDAGSLAAAVSGRVAVVPSEEATLFWDKVMTDYVARIEFQNAIGENELVSEALDIKAETLESKELTPKKEGKSGFSAPSMLEKIKADIGLKPLQASEVVTMMKDFAAESRNLMTEWTAKADAWKKAKLATLEEKLITAWTDEKRDAYLARWREQEEQIAAAIGLIGAGLHLKNDRGLDGYGAITSVKFDDENPITPSAQIFTVHVNTTKRKIPVAASQLVGIAVRAVGDFPAIYEATAERANERYMVTGNLLAAYLSIKDYAPNAKIVTYTDDHGQVRQGILMPAKFTPGSLAKKRVVETAIQMRELLKAGRALNNGDSSVTIVRPQGINVMRVPATRLLGGVYWRDTGLQRLMEGGEFVERGGAMIGKFGDASVPAVFQRLRELNSTLYYTDSTEISAGNPLRAVQALYREAVEPVAKDIGLAVKESLILLQHLVSPSTGVAMEAHDQVMKMLGEQNQEGYRTADVLEAWRQAFDRMPRPEQVAFIDRMKLGEKQPTPELQQIADTLRKIDTESWEAARQAYKALGFKDADVPLSWLENHFRVLWKKIPGGPDKGEWIGKARRGLRGSMGQHKQHTLDTMSDGLAAGGLPYSYNPVVMFKLAQADLWKLTTTLKTWKWAKEHGFVEFVRGPFPKLPDGMVWLDDPIARVYFPAASGEGLIAAGRYAVEEGFGRLLNNYLSRDVIRQTRMGRGLLWIKNATTALELSLSVFHGVFETMEMVGSNIGLGLHKLANRGILKGDLSAAAEGVMDILKSPASPVTGFVLGREIHKAAADPTAYFKTPAGKKMLASYPRAREMIDDLFAGGWKPNALEQDWKNNSVRAFIDALADVKSGASDNYIGAGLRAFPAANEMLMKPLFDYYIPSLKVAQFFHEYAEALEQNERKLKGGVLTRTALARQVWRFVENRFGEMNYDSLFWNANFKTAMQLMFRSVTWKLGSVSAFGGAFGGQGKEFVDAFKERRAPELHRNTAWLFGMLLLTATLGTILSKVLANKTPKNLTDAVFPQIDPKDDKVRVSLPTYFKDVVHLLHDPSGYVTSSMSGWIGRLADLLRNKDYFGTQIRDTDAPATKQALQMGKYAGETLLPFSVRGYKNLNAQDVGTLRKSMAALGINPAPRFISQTPAERAAESFWRGRQTEAGVKPEQFESAAAKRKLVAELRHGEAPNFSAAIAQGNIKPKDVSAIYLRARIGALASQVNHMPLVDAERIYRKANAAERAQLDPIMVRKRRTVQARAGGGSVTTRTMFTGF